MKRLLWACAALVLAGCQTEVTFHNQVPNATIENARWVTDDGTVFAPDADEPLEPGQQSVPVSIPPKYEDSTGRIQFELVVEGRKVALVTDRSFEATANTNSDFEITPDTAARNTLTSSASVTE